MNTYMLSFTSNTGIVTRQEILNYLDTKREILNWYAAMPFTIIVISEETHTTLSELLRNKFSNNITFLLTKIEPHTIDGFINNQVWDFINYPKSSGRWE